jgi:nucleoporin NDC1
LNALGADGPIAKAVDVGAEATHVPELFRSVEARVLSSPVAQEAKKNVDSTKTMGRKLKEELTSITTMYATRYTPELLKGGYRHMIDWWERERTSKVVQASLPFWELDVVVVESNSSYYNLLLAEAERFLIALSYLVCASLTEDQYGIVQRDIPKILETLTSFLSAVEEYQVQITSLIKPLSTSNELSQKEQAALNLVAIEVEKAQEILGGMADGVFICFYMNYFPPPPLEVLIFTLICLVLGLKGGIARIVRTFGDKLLAFKFPPRVAQKLQGFLDYC